MSHYEYKVRAFSNVRDGRWSQETVDNINAKLAADAAEGWTLVETMPPIVIADAALLLFRRAVARKPPEGWV